VPRLSRPSFPFGFPYNPPFSPAHGLGSRESFDRVFRHLRSFYARFWRPIEPAAFSVGIDCHSLKSSDPDPPQLLGQVIPFPLRTPCLPSFASIFRGGMDHSSSPPFSSSPQTEKSRRFLFYPTACFSVETFAKDISRTPFISFGPPSVPPRPFFHIGI